MRTKKRRHDLYLRIEEYKQVGMYAPSSSCCSAWPSLVPCIDQLYSTNSWTGVHRVHNVVQRGHIHNNVSWVSSAHKICMRVPDSCSIFRACFIMQTREQKYICTEFFRCHRILKVKTKLMGTLLGYPFNKFRLKSPEYLHKGHRSWLQSLPL